MAAAKKAAAIAKKKAAAEKKAAAAAAAEAKRKEAAEKKAAAEEERKQKAAEAAAAKKKARARAKAAAPTGPRHPKLGYKWSCFNCAAKFYDLGKPEPVCPKCDSDQRDRPLDSSSSSPAPVKRAAVRPMAPLLDDDDDVGTASRDTSGEFEEGAEPATPELGEAIFDKAADEAEPEDATTPVDPDEVII
jgi:hypothetical protein